MKLITFGDLVLQDGDGVASGAPRRKPLALLALLAAHPGGFPRESLATMLWPESPARQARQSVTQALYALRQELGHSPTLGESTLRLDSAVIRCDLQDLDECLRSGDVEGAMVIAAAPFLDGVHFHGCLEFERWCDERRQDEKLRLVDALIKDARRPDATRAQAAFKWRRILSMAPADDSLAIEAADTLHKLGDDAAAVSLLLRHADTVRQTLDMRAGAEVMSLLARLREGTSAPPAASKGTVHIDADPHVRTEQALELTSPQHQAHVNDATAPAVVNAPHRRRRSRVPLVAAAAVLAAALIGGKQYLEASENQIIPSTRAVALDYFERAEQQLSRGRDGYVAARELYSSAIASDSTFVDALARFAETTARLHWFLLERDSARLREARTMLDRAIALDPASSTAQQALANWHLWIGRDTRLALLALDNILRRAPGNFDALNARAALRRRLGDWTGAADDYAKALAIDPRAYPLLLEFGNTLMMMRNFTEARIHLEAARRLDPTAVDPVAWLSALALRESGDTSAAVQVVAASRSTVDQERLYARIALTFPEVLRTLGAGLFASAAPITLADALGDTAAFHWLAALDRAGNVQQQQRAELETARRVLEVQLQSTPDDLTAMRRLSRVLHALGDTARARSLLENATVTAQRRDDVMVLVAMELAMAQFEASSGNVDRAKVLLGELLAKPSAITEAIVAIDPMWRGVR